MRPNLAKSADGRSTGLTRTEVLVVVGVIAILVGLILVIAPSRSRGTHQTSVRVHCANNLQQIGRGLYIYSVDFQGMFPHNQPYTVPRIEPNLSELHVGRYILDLHTFNCPSMTDNAKDYPNASLPKVNGEDLR